MEEWYKSCHPSKKMNSTPLPIYPFVFFPCFVSYIFFVQNCRLFRQAKPANIKCRRSYPSGRPVPHLLYILHALRKV